MFPFKRKSDVSAPEQLLRHHPELPTTEPLRFPSKPQSNMDQRRSKICLRAFHCLSLQLVTRRCGKMSLSIPRLVWSLEISLRPPSFPPASFHMHRERALGITAQ